MSDILQNTQNINPYLLYETYNTAVHIKLYYWHEALQISGFNKPINKQDMAS